MSPDFAVAVSRARKTVSPVESIACASMFTSALDPASGTSTLSVALSPTKFAMPTIESLCPEMRSSTRAFARPSTGAGPHAPPKRATFLRLKLARALPPCPEGRSFRQAMITSGRSAPMRVRILHRPRARAWGMDYRSLT